MQIRFADARPTGEFALVLPAAGNLRPGIDGLGAARAGVEAALKRNAWNRQATAAELDINRTTLYKKMRKYRLDVGETN